MLLPRAEGDTSVCTNFGDDPAPRNLLERPSRRYGIVEARQTSSLVLTGQEYVHKRQDLRDLLPTLLAPPFGIPIAIKESATSGSADALQELDSRPSS